MRHLIDSYISSEESKKISAFEDASLLDLIITDPEKFEDKMPERIRKNKEAMAETIENNIRKLIIDEQEVNPRYYEQMSKLLDEIIKQRRDEALEYQDYLRKVVELAKKVKEPLEDNDTPTDINTPAKKALYDNL
jgi:type I restriction enzyme, R subunit